LSSLGRALPLFLVCLGCSSPLQRVFSTSGDAASRSGLAALGDGAVFGNEAGRVVRLGPGGAILWSAELAHEVHLTPVVVGETVVAATTGTELVGLNAATGARRWRTELQRTGTALAGLSSRVHLLSDDGELLALEASTGVLLWRSSWGTALGIHPGPARLGLVAAKGDRLLLAGPAAVIALGADGARRWRTALHEATGLLVAEDLVWTVDQGGTVFALDLETGEVRWQRSLGAPPASPPASALDRLWVGLQNQTLVGFRPREDGPLWTVQLPGLAIAPVVEFQGRLLVPTSGQEGRLLALEVGAPGNPPSARLDSPLRTAPLVRGDAVWVLAQDGRVVGFRLRSVGGSER
jgi:outer membrane protein assembly factor BamB